MLRKNGKRQKVTEVVFESVVRTGIGARQIEPGTALMGSLARCDGAQGLTGKKPGKISEVEVPEKSLFPPQNKDATAGTEDRKSNQDQIAKRTNTR